MTVNFYAMHHFTNTHYMLSSNRISLDDEDLQINLRYRIVEVIFEQAKSQGLRYYFKAIAESRGLNLVSVGDTW
jgi:hypothetical protein